MRGLKLVGRQGEGKTISVAPRVGAWIETMLEPIVDTIMAKSHPAWVRGLKRAGLS